MIKLLKIVSIGFLLFMLLTTPVFANDDTACPLPNDPLTGHTDYLWAWESIDSICAWGKTSGMTAIAVLDTGVDQAHEDLFGLAFDFDVINDGSSEFTHGTSVSSIIASKHNNAKGFSGVCESCIIFSYKVSNANGHIDENAVADAIILATNSGVRVINMSFNLIDDYQRVREAIQYAHSRGVLMIASAGNSGLNVVDYPSRYVEVLSIGAIDSAKNLGSISNYGSDLDFVAPGINVLVARGNSYVSDSGTSFAAAYVSGIAGMMISANPRITRDEIVAILQATASDLGKVGKDEKFGYGLPRLNLALSKMKKIALLPLAQRPPIAAVSASSVSSIQTSGSVTVTKNYIDCEGSDHCMLEYTYMIYGSNIDADTAAIQVQEQPTDDWVTISTQRRNGSNINFIIGASYVYPSVSFRVVATTNGSEWEVPIAMIDLTANRMFLPIAKK